MIDRQLEEIIEKIATQHAERIESECLQVLLSGGIPVIVQRENDFFGSEVIDKRVMYLEQ